MTTAHIFYIPVILFVGVFAGYFLGRRSVEEEQRRRKKKRARRQALREKHRKDPAERAQPSVGQSSDEQPQEEATSHS